MGRSLVPGPKQEHARHAMRYLKLYGSFVRFGFSRALQFRLDFTFRIFMDVLWYTVNLAFFVVVFGHTGRLGGWTSDQVYVFAAGLFLADAVNMTVFSNNLWMLPISINKGDIDYHLLRPVSPLFMLSLRDFAANSFVNLMITVGIFIWAVARYPGTLGVGPVLGFVGLVLCGTILHYAIAMIFIIPTFWTHSAGGFREIFWSVDSFTQRPHRIYRGWVRRILMSLLPLAMVVSVPALALFEGAWAWAVPAVLGATGTVFLAMSLLWRAGLRSYGSASS